MTEPEGAPEAEPALDTPRFYTAEEIAVSPELEGKTPQQPGLGSS